MTEQAQRRWEGLCELAQLSGARRGVLYYEPGKLLIVRTRFYNAPDAAVSVFDGRGGYVLEHYDALPIRFSGDPLPRGYAYEAQPGALREYVGL